MHRLCNMKHQILSQSCIFREFVSLCGKALDVNAVLIKPDQEMYQEDLKTKYEDLKEKLAPFIGLVILQLIIFNHDSSFINFYILRYIAQVKLVCVLN